MELILISLFAWILTILAPCVLPLLPIILAWSLEDKKIKTSIQIILWLSLSIFVFSILLKATTYFINIPDYFWKSISWIILIFFWIITIFPNLWKKITSKSKIDEKTNEIFSKSTQSNSKFKNYLIWISLWPIFSSCSPTYSLILAVIFPNSIIMWSIYLIFYILWLALMLFLISIFWQKLVKKLKFFSNPNWYFKKALWIIFLIIWIFIITWIDKKIESKILENWNFDITQFEQRFLENIENEF